VYGRDPAQSKELSMKGLHHTAITVSNLDRAIDFYCEVLGLELAHEPTDTFSGEFVERALRVPGATLRIAVVRSGGHRIELLEYASPPSPVERPLPGNARGATHIAFLVDDLDAKRAELEAKGVEFFADSVTNDGGSLAGWRWVYFADPDGVVLELVEEVFRRDEDRQAGVAAYWAGRGK
jgi:catechol 2,3-dioxygenase-like lactoylglutathione lyase family enzyme